MIQTSTRLFAVLGDPVAHSLSPSIQNPAFVAAGVDGVYVSLACVSSDLGGLIRGIARAGGGGNVTLPHKEAAARVVDEPSELVQETGACNTFWLADGRIHGENTDVAGFEGAVESLLMRPLRGLNVLLLGAGGAARAALVGLVRGDAASVVIFNRSEERAHRLALELGGDRTRVIGSEEALRSETFDLIVNSTSLGLASDDAMPIDLDSVPSPGAVLDLAYRPEETDLVREARARGIPAADGGEMLVRQGAAAFEHWWNQPAPLTVMMAALFDLRHEPLDGRQTE